jgi:hypothetical protein
MPGRSCRPGRLGGATRSAPHFAWGDRLERHCRRCMSHCTRTRGDTFALECRPSRARRATRKGWAVAPRADPERHARICMSLRTSVRRDMDRALASPDRSSKATFTLLLVVQRAWVWRHAAATSATSTRETVALGSQAGGPRETGGKRAWSRCWNRCARWACRSGSGGTRRTRHRPNGSRIASVRRRFSSGGARCALGLPRRGWARRAGGQSTLRGKSGDAKRSARISSIRQSRRC